MVDRKKELKKWFLDHSDVTAKKAGDIYGCSKQSAHKWLFNCDSAPAKFVKVCSDLGVPPNLLPASTQTKAELKAELFAAKVQLTECWDALGGCCFTEISSG